MDRERARGFSLLNRPGPPPLEIVRSEGCHLFTASGHRILDAAGGAVMVNIGHGRRDVADVYANAVAEATFVVPPFATESRVRLVERLRESWLPSGLTRAFFTSGGSESMDAAVRLARQHHVCAGRPERWKVIGRDVSYHGTTLATLAIGGHEQRRGPFLPLLTDHPKAPACYCARCPLGLRYPACDVACASEIERVIEREGPESVAAFVAEPIVGSSGGALVPPDEYWPRVVEICRRHGVLIIADEVMTGFGRTGRRFAMDHWDQVPDILVSGKGLTGGYAPMGGVYTSAEIVAPIEESGGDFMYYTYSGHPASCAVADKVLGILEDEGLVERAAKMGEILGQRLEALREHPHVGDVRGRGLLWAVELVQEKETLKPFARADTMTMKVTIDALTNGVFFYPGGAEPARDVILMGPPFIIQETEIHRMVDVLTQSIDSATQRAARRHRRRERKQRWKPPWRSSDRSD